MPLYAHIILIVIGIAIVALNIWYMRIGFRVRKMEESFGFDTDQDNYSKPGRREDHRFQFWILTIGNVIGVFLACIVILSFVANDVTVLIHYLGTHSAATPTPKE